MNRQRWVPVVSSWGKGKELQISNNRNRDEVESEKKQILCLMCRKYELRSVPVMQTIFSPVPGTLGAPWSSTEVQAEGEGVS